jgi:LPXTG-motif cell wall-anchored protein
MNKKTIGLSVLGIGLLSVGLFLLFKKDKDSNFDGDSASGSRKKLKCPKGYYESKGVCIVIPNTGAVTKSLYE